MWKLYNRNGDCLGEFVNPILGNAKKSVEDTRTP